VQVPIPGEEGLEVFQKRILAAMDDIVARHSQEDTGAVIAHGGVWSIYLARLVGIDVNRRQPWIFGKRFIEHCLVGRHPSANRPAQRYVPPGSRELMGASYRRGRRERRGFYSSSGGEHEHSGQKIRLRPIERSDIPTFVRWFNDPEVTQYLKMYLPMSLAQEERWFEAQLGPARPGHFGN